MSGTWSTLLHQPGVPIDTMLLLTDGTVMAHELSTPNWHRLTPDAMGRYELGTWSAMPAMLNNPSIPTAVGGPVYAPLFFGSAVLRDGTVFIAGGEYNKGIPADLGVAARFDPVAGSAGTWINVGAPDGWTKLADIGLCTLDNGQVLLANIDDHQTAFFDPSTNGYTPGPNKLDRGAEESYTLMPDGTVIVVQCTNIPGSEKYVPSIDNWIPAGNTPSTLPQALPGIVAEIGPTVLLATGHAFAIGATGNTALYSSGPVPSSPGTWSAGPQLVSGGITMHPSDAPAVLLPNGKVLLTASPPPTPAESFPSPTTFFEYDPFTNPTNPPVVVPSPVNYDTPCFRGRLLLLPSGKVLYSSQSSTVAIYTPDSGPAASWRPVITSMATVLHPGQTYTLTGHQLNGLSQACFYGDDATMATNYPIVRLTNISTGAVTYCRTANHSTMGVATGLAPVTTDLMVPNGLLNGAYRLEVVANGIPSVPLDVTVHPPKHKEKDWKEAKEFKEKDWKEAKEFKEFKAESKENKLEVKEFDKRSVDKVPKEIEHDFNQIQQWVTDPALMATFQDLSNRIDLLTEALLQRTPIIPAERPEVGEAPLLHSKRKKASERPASGGGSITRAERPEVRDLRQPHSRRKKTRELSPSGGGSSKSGAKS